ncbi:MAG: uvrA, partial [Thermoleophilia bacterium]|nr:uvrA [Thermoleophilia bacterium]
SDWVIDMGPGGGQRGGNVIFEGTPRDLCRDRTSLTAQALHQALNEQPAPQRRRLASVS